MANEQELVARLKTFALMLKYGHDLFGAKHFEEAALAAINNARIMLNFRTSTLLERTGGTVKILAQYGQVTVNSHSRLAVLQSRLCAKLKFQDAEPLTLKAGEGLPEELAENEAVYYVLKLPIPANTDKVAFEFIWILEYEKEVPPYAANAAKLLANSIGESLCYQRLCKGAGWNIRHHATKRWLWLLLVCAVVAALVYVRVPESATAEFTVVPSEITSAYAWFDGPIAHVLKQDGDQVNAGEIIAEYDVSQLKYKLAMAQSTVREVEAELALEQQNAFLEEERLGRAKLLETRLESAKIEVEEAQWYLDHSQVKAPAEGILALADGRAEQLIGKAVRTGDKLFDIYGGKGMMAEIPVDERDASVIRKMFKTTCFLHTEPETPIPIKVVEIAQYPELTEQRVYCYNLRAEMPENTPSLRYGMRGIARLTGDEVNLGYYLFKNVVLYFRGL